MKRTWWTIWLAILTLILTVGNIGETHGFYVDPESSSGNTFQAWTSIQWTQTNQGDFEDGVLSSVDTSSSPGDVKLAFTSSITTNSPTTNTGSAWTNPTNAYADSGGAATITSGSPSGNNIWGNYGFNLTGNTVNQVRVRYDAWSTPSAYYSTPTYKGAGTFTSGTGAITPPMPTGAAAPAANDILLLVVESENQPISLSSAQGFAEVPNSLQFAGTAATDPASRLTIYWKRAVGGDTAPTVTDSGNHTTGRIYCFSGVKTTGDPWNVTAGGNDGGANDTSGVIPGATTTVSNCLVVLICTSSYNGTSTAQFSAWTNGDLANITERGDNTNTAGLGGGHGMATGEKVTAGTYAATGVTLAQTSFKGAVSIALEPALVYYSTPTYKGAGTFTSGTGAITPPMPTGVAAPAANDILLLVVESENQAISLSSAQGFAEVPDSLQFAGTAATNPASRLTIYWKRAVGGDTAPTVTDSGDHTTGRIYCFSGVKTTGDPWNVTAGGNDGGANDTSGVIPGATTTVPNCLVVLICTSSYNGTSTAQFSAWTNSDLVNITERGDNTNTAGLGGGHGMATGEKATAGTYAATGVTLAQTSFKGAVSIALEPELVNEQIRVDVSWDGGTNWSSKQTTTLTAAEETYWYDVTGATTWTLAKLADGQFLVRVDAQTVGVASTVSLDWLPVEISYTEYVSSGTIASQVLDTTVAGARWDALFWDEILQSNTDVTFEVRASDVLFTKDDAILPWISVGGISPVTSALPFGQYKQWRAVLTTSDVSKTPVLNEVRIYHY
ncbi:MAG TPA: hypothetical protein VGA85_03385 [Dehalococcoidales bacterium]